MISKNQRDSIIKLSAGASVALALALAGCAKPPEVAAAPPPAPVGHTYATLVEVPPAPHYVHIKPDDQEKLQQAFNVIGLKSALMVAALSCNQQDRYDAFMTSFQPHILDDQHMMDKYFRRIDGAAYRAKEDNFVTLLANNQSVGGLGQGKIFCLNNQAEFDKVMTFKSPDDLDAFVTDQSPVPSTAQVDDTPPAPVTHHYTHKKLLKPAAATATNAAAPATHS